MGDGHPMMMKLAALGLDDKQQETAKAIHAKVRKASIRKQADREIATIELGEILSHDPVDITAAEAKLKQIESVRTDLHLAHIKAREEIKTIDTIQAGVSLTMTQNLTYTHTLAQADPVQIDMTTGAALPTTNNFYETPLVEQAQPIRHTRLTNNTWEISLRVREVWP